MLLSILKLPFRAVRKIVRTATGSSAPAPEPAPAPRPMPAEPPAWMREEQEHSHEHVVDHICSMQSPRWKRLRMNWMKVLWKWNRK